MPRSGGRMFQAEEADGTKARGKNKPDMSQK